MALQGPRAFGLCLLARCPLGHVATGREWAVQMSPETEKSLKQWRRKEGHQLHPLLCHVPSLTAPILKDTEVRGWSVAGEGRESPVSGSLLLRRPSLPLSDHFVS